MKWFITWLLITLIPAVLIYLAAGFTTWGASFDMSLWTEETRAGVVGFSALWGIIVFFTVMEDML